MWSTIKLLLRYILIPTVVRCSPVVAPLKCNYTSTRTPDNKEAAMKLERIATDDGGRLPPFDHYLYDLHAAETVRADQVWLLPSDKEDACRLWMIAEGMGNLWLADRAYPISIGKCFLSVPDTPVKLSPHFNTISVFVLTFGLVLRPSRQARTARAVGASQSPSAPLNQTDTEETASLSAFSIDAEPPAPGELQTSGPGHLLELAEALCQAGGSGDRVDTAREMLLFHELLYELAKAGDNAWTEDGATRRAVEQTIRHIEHHYSEPLSRDKLAAMAGISPEYYSALFKQISGKSVTDYVAAVRIRHVQERLLSSKDKLADIARHTGYRDEYYLSRKFKQTVGMPPTAYLKAAKRVVSLNPHLTKHLLALGIAPAATLAFPWGFGEHESSLREAHCVCRDWAAGFDEDELRRLQPDILLCLDNLSPEQLHRYRLLAPTLVIPWYTDDWRSHLRAIAHAVGREEEASAWLARFDAKVENVRSRLPPDLMQDGTVTLLNIRAESAYIYKKRSMGCTILYDELGLKPPEAVLNTATEKAFIPVRLERVLLDYAADRILIAAENTPDGRRRTRLLLESEPWR